jgi:hypothetical protein
LHAVTRLIASQRRFDIVMAWADGYTALMRDRGFCRDNYRGTKLNFHYRRESRRLLAHTRFLKTLSVLPATTCFSLHRS